MQISRICVVADLSHVDCTAVQIESSLRLLSSGCQGFFEVGFDGEGVAALVPGRIVVAGSGSGLSEEPAFGV
jgi:hypothetical protein